MTGFLSRLLGRSAPAATFTGAPPAPDAPLCVIGDVHGCAAKLDALLARIAEQAAGAHIVTLGDYVDRGEDSAAVLRRIKAMQEAGAATCLIGNHEEMMLDWVTRGYPGWLRYGGLQTLASFGLGRGLSEEGGEAAEAARAALGAALRDEGLWDWIAALPRSLQSGNVAITHAGADPARPIGVQQRAVTWGHAGFLTTPRQDGLWVVYGHTVVDTLEVGPGRIGIDTGAYATGRLSAVVLEAGQAPRFISV